MAGAVECLRPARFAGSAATLARVSLSDDATAASESALSPLGAGDCRLLQLLDAPGILHNPRNSRDGSANWRMARPRANFSAGQPGEACGPDLVCGLACDWCDRGRCRIRAALDVQAAGPGHRPLRFTEEASAGLCPFLRPLPGSDSTGDGRIPASIVWGCRRIAAGNLGELDSPAPWQGRRWERSPGRDDDHR